MKKIMMFAIISVLISFIGVFLLRFRPGGIAIWCAVAVLVLGCILEIIAMGRLMVYSLKQNKE